MHGRMVIGSSQAVDGKAGSGESNEELAEASCFDRLEFLLYDRRGKRTEDELLRGREHVKRESDLVLIAFALQPSDHVRSI